jgi:Zn-dependent oligopeptidase
MKRIILTLSLLTLSFQLSAQKTLPDIAKAILQESFTIATDVLEANLAAGSLTLSKAEKEQQEKLTSQEKYLVEQILKEGKRRGLGLPVEQRQKIVALEKELAELETEFSKNIYGDNRSIQVSKEELAGLDEDFINSLKRTPEGLYLQEDQCLCVYNLVKDYQENIVLFLLSFHAVHYELRTH